MPTRAATVVQQLFYVLLHFLFYLWSLLKRYCYCDGVTDAGWQFAQFSFTAWFPQTVCVAYSHLRVAIASEPAPSHALVADLTAVRRLLCRVDYRDRIQQDRHRTAIHSCIPQIAINQFIQHKKFLIMKLHIGTSSSSGRSVAASNDTWRIEIKCAFPGPTATRCCSCSNHSVVYNIQGGPKKLSYHILSIALLNVDQFSQFFH